MEDGDPDDGPDEPADPQAEERPYSAPEGRPDLGSGSSVPDEAPPQARSAGGDDEGMMPAGDADRAVADGAHTPHGRPTESAPSLFERDPADVAAATPADVPEIVDPTPTHGGATHDGPPVPGGEVPEPGEYEEYEGAPDDEEMPLADHVEEMAMRLFVVVGVMAVVAVLALPSSEELINFLWYSFHEGTVEQAAEVCGRVTTASAGSVGGSDVNCAYVYQPLALILARLKVASLVGFVVALPVFVFETYLFMRPGLYPKERRYYLAAVPTSLVLAAIGVAFAYFAVLPAMFDYFITYSDRATDLAFGLSHTFGIIILMLGLFALIFQIPLFVMLAIMMGLTTRRWLADRRLYFWGAFAAIAFLFSPDPTGMAPLMVAVTMVGLFEGTLLLLRWTQESSPIPTAEDLADRRPTAWLLAAFAGYVLSPAPVPTGYYARLPPAVTDTLASVGLGAATPMLLGGGVIVAFELLAYANKNYYGSVRLWKALRRARLPVWGVAIVVGYLASPDPTLFRLVNQFSLPATAAVAAAGALVALYEGGLLWAGYRSSEPEPVDAE